MYKYYNKHNDIMVPLIEGAKGGKGGGGGGSRKPTEDPNSLFSTDILFTTVGLGEGPIYRINPNGPQDIQITDSSIDDLINLYGDGAENEEKFKTLSATGTNTQDPLPVFGEAIFTPQTFATPVILRKGTTAGIPRVAVEEQETSTNDWDSLRFKFQIDALQRIDNGTGDIKTHKITIKITIKSRVSRAVIAEKEETISGKTNSPFKFNITVPIDEQYLDTDGYRFDIEKTSDDSASSSTAEAVKAIGWDEIKNTKQAYPRTAVIGYAVKATNEHQSAIPSFTSLIKGLLCKVPSNYNQPTLQSGEIDWRHVEVSDALRQSQGYYLQGAGILPQSTNGTGSASDIFGEGIDIVEASGTSGYTSFSTTITQANSGYSGNQNTVNWNVIRENAGSGTANFVGYVIDDVITASGSNNQKALTVKVNDVTVVSLGNAGGSWGPITLNPGDKFEWTCFGGAGGGGTINRSQRVTWTRTGSAQFMYTTNTNGGSSGSISTKTLTLTNNNTGGFDISLVRPTTGITDETLVENGNSVTLLSDLGSTTASWDLKLFVLPTGVTSANKKFTVDPQIYVGTWDGQFVYSWTQNPVWVVYDLLTNSTYGLNVPEDHIDKYKFYQAAQYCDACDFITGKFVGVDGLADGSFRYKPLGQFDTILQNQIGLAEGTPIRERRFVCDVSVDNEVLGIDIINHLCASFRSALVYSMGKLTLAMDMPDEFPVAVFNEANIKDGSLAISGTKESELLTGVDISYMEPTNHFKREVVRIDSIESNDGLSRNSIPNVEAIDLLGCTRRSQALRYGQYQLAASRYQRRSITFTTSSEALVLAPGDVISVAQQMTGIAYGYGGKITQDSGVASNSNIFVEHYTAPSLSNSVFTANTGPIAFRVIKAKDDRVDLYLLSNTAFELTNTGNVGVGFDFGELNAEKVYNRITKQFDTLTNFNANNAPEKGDLWTLGEIENPDNFYTSKAGKLFKITNINREDDEEISISAIEYISNVYVDSDTFIDYTPTAYTDIQSPLAVPPSPLFEFTAVPRKNPDGSLLVDGLIENSTERLGFAQDISTEFFVSRPEHFTLINNLAQGTNFLQVSNANALSDGATAILQGKNGFTASAGEIRLLCNTVSVVDTAGGTLDGNVQFTVEGLNVAFDENFFEHVLDVNNTGIFANLKGTDFASFPIVDKTSAQGFLNFVGFAPDISEYSANISGFDTVNNTIKVSNFENSGLNLIDVIPAAPFYVTINQLLDSRYTANNSFYLSGSEKTYVTEGVFDTTGQVVNIDTEIRPRRSEFLRFYVDGIQKSSGQFTVNINKNSSQDANIQYTPSSTDSEYRIEIDDYNVPIIETGDNVEVSFNNVYVVSNTSYDPLDASYNAALTSNHIYRVTLSTAPTANLAGLFFINQSLDPIGTIGNSNTVSLAVNSNISLSGFCTLDYDRNTFPGKFNLGDYRVYDLAVTSDFEQIFLTKDGLIRNLPIGATTVKARNRTMLGRLSPFVTRTVTVRNLPIQRVTNLTVSESLYRDTTGGVSTRCTVIFDHIQGQNVTDYEISYRLDNIDNVGTDDGGADLTSFNTVKIAAQGVDSDGKIRFTVNGINRGLTSETNFIVFRITPLNKEIRGVTATVSKSILGKLSTPGNVFNFTGGQQIDQITLLWDYPRASDGELLDLDLKEVVIKRAPGTVANTIANFVASDPLVTVSAGTARKSIPIDTFGEFTYLARTRDTSGNFSEDVQSITLSTSRPDRSTVVAAYNEDSPSVAFTNITNTNDGENNYPSFADSNTGGLAFSIPDSSFDSSLVDNANGSSSGFSAIGGSPTDLLAADSAEYVTQLRDFGATVTGAVFVDIEGTQEIKSTFNDQYEIIFSGVTEESPVNNVLVDVDFDGIGHVLGFSNTNVSSPRFDSNNKTWMSGGVAGNVYGIWNEGQFANDTTNANSYALIAGLINANAIELGASFFANGDPTGSNGFANIVTTGNTYKLVNFTQYSDTGSGDTYEGSLGAIASQVLIRTTTADNSTAYYSNGNVNTSVFTGSSINDGFITYQAGSRTFRQFQLKFILNNSKPNDFDFTIDKFRYSIEKDTVTFTETVTYDSEPKTVSFTSASFLNRPVISYAVLDQEDAIANPAIVVTTAASNQQVQFQLVAADGTGSYQANSTANIMVTAVGV